MQILEIKNSELLTKDEYFKCIYIPYIGVGKVAQKNIKS